MWREASSLLSVTKDLRRCGVWTSRPRSQALRAGAASSLKRRGMDQTKPEKSSIMFIEYRRPVRDGTDIGPQRSTYTRPSGALALSPSLTFGTDEQVCFPRMQCSHF